jgi:hypothetical protein
MKKRNIRQVSVAHTLTEDCQRISHVIQSESRSRKAYLLLCFQVHKLSDHVKVNLSHRRLDVYYQLRTPLNIRSLAHV